MSNSNVKNYQRVVGCYLKVNVCLKTENPGVDMKNVDYCLKLFKPAKWTSWNFKLETDRMFRGKHFCCGCFTSLDIT